MGFVGAPLFVSIITTIKSMTGPWFFFLLRGARGRYYATDDGQGCAGKDTGVGAKIAGLISQM